MRFGGELGGLIECELYDFVARKRDWSLEGVGLGGVLGKMIRNTIGIFLESKFFETNILLHFNITFETFPPISIMFFGIFTRCVFFFRNQYLRVPTPDSVSPCLRLDAVRLKHAFLFPKHFKSLEKILFSFMLLFL
jgi:hypothetical protein